MCVKLLETHICIHEACRRTRLKIHIIFLEKKEIKCIFKTCCIISVLFFTEWHLVHDFIILCSINTVFINHVLKFNFPTS